MPLTTYAGIVGTTAQGDREELSITSDILEKKLTPQQLLELDIIDNFGDDICGHILDMTKHWEQFGFFDMGNRVKIASDLARMSLKCIKHVVVHVESDDEDLKEGEIEGEDF